MAFLAARAPNHDLASVDRAPPGSSAPGATSVAAHVTVVRCSQPAARSPMLTSRESNLARPLVLGLDCGRCSIPGRFWKALAKARYELVPRIRSKD